MKRIALAVLLMSSFQAMATPASPRLEELFSRDTIGATVAYVESKVGPAWKVFEDTRIYKVDGCEVTMTAAGGDVASVSMDLSSKCTATLEDLLGEVGPGRPPIHQMTFAQLEQALGQGRFTADCISLCGNAYDPLVYQEWSGYRANGFLDFRAGVHQVEESTLDAVGQWRSVMVQQRGEDYVIDTKFNCDRAYDELAHGLFKNVRITQITLDNPSADMGCKTP